MMKGFTILEILVVISILVVVAVAAFFLPKNINSKQVVDKGTLLTLSVIEEARSMTLSSRDNSVYGVHFESSQIVLFKGARYIEGEPSNVVSDLNSLISFESVVLVGGGTDLVFERLTGKTSQNGVVTISLNSDTSINKTVTIYETGLSEIN
jgi:prepilin-type N-terminal cleavage/methylation domain-containing protein